MCLFDTLFKSEVGQFHMLLNQTLCQRVIFFIHEFDVFLHLLWSGHGDYDELWNIHKFLIWSVGDSSPCPSESSYVPARGLNGHISFLSIYSTSIPCLDWERLQRGPLDGGGPSLGIKWDESNENLWLVWIPLSNGLVWSGLVKENNDGLIFVGWKWVDIWEDKATTH